MMETIKNRVEGVERTKDKGTKPTEEEAEVPQFRHLLNQGIGKILLKRNLVTVPATFRQGT